MSAFGLCLLMIILLTALCFVLVISLIAVYFFISSCFMQYPPPVPSSGRLKEKILENLREYLRQQKNMTAQNGPANRFTPIFRDHIVSMF